VAAGTRTIALMSKRHGRRHHVPNALIAQAILSLPDPPDGSRIVVLDCPPVLPKEERSELRSLLLALTLAKESAEVPEWYVEHAITHLLNHAHSSHTELGGLGLVHGDLAWRLHGDALNPTIVPSTAVLGAALLRLMMFRDGTTKFQIVQP
jgi:hypothetical protein